MSLNPLGELLGALHTAPNLHGARCVGLRTIFDRAADNPTDERALRSAKRICASCPVLGACAAWVASLPKGKQPFGCTAGQLRLKAS